MAGHLARVGHSVTVFNRTMARAEAWASEHGGRCAPTPASAASGVDFVFCCVGGDDDLRAITLGPEGALGAMRPGTTLVDHTTTSAGVAREVGARAAECGVGFVDAPVAGGVKGAVAGKLSVMMGGDTESVERVAPLIDAYAAGRRHMGSIGSGQLTKMVNQICATGIIQSLAEGLAFAERAGLDGEAVIDVISKGSAASWQIGNRARPMLDRDFSGGGGVGLLFKDLGICLEEAARLGIDLPVATLVRSFYRRFVDDGAGGLDAACVISLIDGSRDSGA
jgi:3-hydroxyisobutyrate dehydrogenase